MTYVVQQLFAMKDEAYHEFHSRLIPNVDPDVVIGVRMPQLRTFAQRLAGTPAETEFLVKLPHRYYEENNLHALLINGMKDPEQVFSALECFLPYIDNWATCDSLRPKVFKHCRTELLEHIRIWLKSGHTYTVRFGLEMLMVHYLDEDFCPEYLEMAAKTAGEDYYIRMMVAWYFATALAKQYESSVGYLENKVLDRWTHHKAIQKAIESYRITPEQKEYLRTLRD